VIFTDAKNGEIVVYIAAQIKKEGSLIKFMF